MDRKSPEAARGHCGRGPRRVVVHKQPRSEVEQPGRLDSGPPDLSARAGTAPRPAPGLPPARDESGGCRSGRDGLPRPYGAELGARGAPGLPLSCPVAARFAPIGAEAAPAVIVYVPAWLPTWAPPRSPGPTSPPAPRRRRGPTWRATRPLTSRGRGSFPVLASRAGCAHRRLARGSHQGNGRPCGRRGQEAALSVRHGHGGLHRLLDQHRARVDPPRPVPAPAPYGAPRAFSTAARAPRAGCPRRSGWRTPWSCPRSCAAPAAARGGCPASRGRGSSGPSAARRGS